MSNHKYSHALVMSHFQTRGLLEDTHATPKSRSSSSSRMSQSWTISEVLPSSKPLRSTSPGRVTELSKEERKASLAPPASKQALESSVPLSRSDSVVTQVYAPRLSSSPPERHRAPKSRSSRGLSGLRASVIPHQGTWEPRLAARGVASPVPPRCGCGGIVQDARLQSSYFPDTKPIQKALPGLPGSASGTTAKDIYDVQVQEQGSMERFELAATSSPHLLPTTEATVKPIRRMAPPRSPTNKTPNSERSSGSWPNLQPTSNAFATEGSAESNSEAATNSRPLSSQTTPPTSPSLESLFSPLDKRSQDHMNREEFSKVPIHDKDVVMLPWDDPTMGPALFCSSPPPCMDYPQPPPSPGSSIDDALPPPISRVRRPQSKPPTAARRTSFTASTSQFRRSMVLSSPSETRPKTSSGPAPAVPDSTPQRPPLPQILHSYRIQKARSPSLNPRTDVRTIPYSHTTAGPEPIPTTERVAPPPPLRGGLIRRDKEKEVEKWRWGKMREMLGFGNRGKRGIDTAFMRGMVPH